MELFIRNVIALSQQERDADDLGHDKSIGDDVWKLSVKEELLSVLTVGTEDIYTQN